MGAIVVGSLWACTSLPPPESPDRACDIFQGRIAWYRASRAAEQTWGVPMGLQLAVIHQESRFDAQARPARSRVLGVLPGPRPSSAYGYGQVLDTTWAEYQRRTGRMRASRTHFPDVVEFIGWYARQIESRTGIARDDAYRFYLAYHEGPGGYLRGTYRDKQWLQGVAKRVNSRASTYAAQLAECRVKLDARADRAWWWPL